MAALLKDKNDSLDKYISTFFLNPDCEELTISTRKTMALSGNVNAKKKSEIVLPQVTLRVEP